ncbi:hypothetical protein JCM11641_007102 [Rhodosporidiobolus odoratus]
MPEDAMDHQSSLSALKTQHITSHVPLRVNCDDATEQSTAAVQVAGAKSRRQIQRDTSLQPATSLEFLPVRIEQVAQSVSESTSVGTSISKPKLAALPQRRLRSNSGILPSSTLPDVTAARPSTSTTDSNSSPPNIQTALPRFYAPPAASTSKRWSRRSASTSKTAARRFTSTSFPLPSPLKLQPAVPGLHCPLALSTSDSMSRRPSLTSTASLLSVESTPPLTPSTLSASPAPPPITPLSLDAVRMRPSDGGRSNPGAVRKVSNLTARADDALEALQNTSLVLGMDLGEQEGDAAMQSRDENDDECIPSGLLRSVASTSSLGTKRRRSENEAYEGSGLVEMRVNRGRAVL